MEAATKLDTPPRYKIIRSDDYVDLAAAVNAAMERGYRPLGGVAHSPQSVTTTGGFQMPLIYQAMIRD